MPKRAKSILESNEILLPIIQQAHESIVVVDEEQKIIFFNQGAEYTFGYSAAEILNQPLEILLPDSVAKVHQAHVRDFVQSPDQARLMGEQREILGRRKDGSLFPAEANITKVSYNGKPLLAAILRDITKRKQAEESSNRMVAIVASSDDAIIGKDLNSIVTHWNFGAEKIFGYAADEIVGTSIVRLIPVERQSEESQILRQIKLGKSIEHFETVRQTKDGRRIDVSITVSPIKDATGKVIGVSKIARDITKDKQAEIALQQTNEKLQTLVAELERHNLESALLKEMSDLLQACTSTEEAYRTIKHVGPRLFPASIGALYLRSPSRNDLDTVLTWGDFPQDQSAQIFEAANCWALRRGRPHKIDALCVGLPCRSMPASHKGLCIPMIAQGESLGTLYLYGKTESDASPFNEQMATTASEQIALALANLNLRETLRNQSIVDPLTALFNRRYMTETLSREFKRAERSQRPLSLIMLDIDHFKKINDTFGHEAGDAILREFGKFLKTNTRVGDVACRFGGEEFVLILPETQLEDAQQKAEELREKIHYIATSFQGQSLGNITSSFGVATYPTHATAPEALLHAADTALYRAKAEGRDRVVTAESASTG
jgi:diguanylate cyclase (GGDEF)-like protein/PAS domain S-box-containing protein